MERAQVIFITFCVLHIGAAMDAFLDCPGNDQWWRYFRRCCTSPQLPNGCECFDISPSSDFTNTGYRLPDCPHKVGVEFHLFTRNNWNTSVIVKSYDGSLASSPFQPNKPIKFIVHGFMSTGPNEYTTAMKNNLLDDEDMNVIIVNWEEGAKGLDYYQASANARTVGAMVAQLIYVMSTEHGVDLNAVHLIGHSLGSHVSGMAGKEVRRLTNELLVGRITGLDPAGPAFETASANVRLDKGDAVFVDVIHTDAESLLSSGFGIQKSIGDVDYYPNGGKHQPSCPPEIGGILSMLDFSAAIDEGGACSHFTCLDYFIHSISQCIYWPPYGDPKECNMGYRGSSSCKGDYYPVTTDTPPYC